MIKRKFSVSVARKLLQLLEGQALPSSSFPKWMATELLEEVLITVQTHGSRISYIVLDVEGTIRYLETNYTGGASLQRWISLNEKADSDLNRAELVKETSDSKSKSLRTFQGFLVNCCEPIEARLGEERLVLSPTYGTAVFIQRPELFRIAADVLVVGVENGENFREIRRQRHLFSAPKVLFVSRYPRSSDLRKWLMKSDNAYLHFGDFDCAGIEIYQCEFYRYLGNRASFFIPEDIEERLKQGNRLLYDKQYAKFHRMKVEDERVQHLVDMIHRYRRVYEQEGYLE